MPEDIWCQSCFGDLPEGAEKYCSNACRQRAYRRRKDIARKSGSPTLVTQAEFINSMAAALHPDGFNDWSPGAKAHLAKVLKRVLKTL
jgi:hypothetical protein